MYAIIEDGGKQYKVQQGVKVCIELRKIEDGQTTAEVDKVLFVRDGETVTIGKPYLDGAKVVANIATDATGPKLYPMHFKRRKNSRSRIGHRQKYLEVEVTEIKGS